MLVSFVIPCFNAIDKIGRCMASLERLHFDPALYEALFVDDCSTDGTDELIKKTCTQVENWRFIQLERNSGSPSRPRNKGIEEARGKYIYFLDCDDEILPDALNELTRLAEETDACLIRSELLAENGKQRKRMNQMDSWHSALTKKEKIELIIKKQSTVVTSFVKADLLRKHSIRWPEHLRMGEDTVFLATMLAHAEVVEYLASPTFIYFKIPSMTPASTQRYGRRELSDHLEVWSSTQQLLEPLGINYIQVRLNVGLRVSIESLIFKNRGDVNVETFDKFSRFVRTHWAILKKFKYSRRINEVLLSIQSGEYAAFLKLTKPRLLIAGHDLKFIEDATPELSEYFDIRFDKWQGHAIHDEVQSRECLEWAEYIWCEWLLGNAEWYAKHKKPRQRLVVRMHRMELARDHGSNMDLDKVDAVVAVSTYFFERLLEKYPNIPRHKARLMHNYVRVDDYDTTWHPDRLFTLGIIGVLPSRKGYKKALEILKELKKHDVRFNLKVFGKRAEDLAWVAKNPTEMAYFSDCQTYIEENGLQDSVDFVGHVDIKKELARQKVGYVLSVSDPDLDFPGPESFHLAIADGFAGGGVSLVQHWPGAEYIWPENSLGKNQDAVVDEVIKFANEEPSFQTASQLGMSFLRENYNVSKFSVEFNCLFLELI
ncbi:glycosyltransferase [Halomonas alkaliantarctica]|uniref:glycosyltransferase n=1 Tax=Halomonas alkaliantarctica TaxID=232346 RepID=UPI0004A9F9D6|nr:glycosyltransferase [Halomonas alkaliantarctica]